ncbi:MAG: HAD family hydrolase [Elusimicrobia bacterium]|nr:HAD family hydrolase [Elusimicrobiota bacterium]
MLKLPIRAVSFDLWDTVFADDSDEPKRKKLGLPAKKIERRDLVQRCLKSAAVIRREAIDAACDKIDAAFKKAWQEDHVTWPVIKRLQMILTELKRKLPQKKLLELAKLHEEMELRVPPDLVPGATEAIKKLKKRYRLVVVSDAIVTPGRALRKLLKNYGLYNCFNGFVFSDEFGRSKPAVEVFRQAAKTAGCRLEEIVHIGDREENDVAGAKAAGCRAILMTAAVNRGSSRTKADAICRDWRELPSIIESL